MKNPIERRLDMLHDQWTEFAEAPAARLLRWVVEPREVRMVDAFLAKEGDERIGELPDLFLRFTEPFEDGQSYGHRLYQSLVRRWEEVRASLEAEGWRADWSVPPVEQGASDIDSLLAACASLREHCAEVCDLLALVLTPSEVADAEAWRQWLMRAVRQAEDLPHVRFIVLDDLKAPVLDPLAEAEPERTRTVVAGLDMAGALEKLSRQAGQLHTPGGQFRELFVRVGNAAARGDLRAVERLGEKAVQLAQQQRWPALAVAAHFAMGGALLGARQALGALLHYRRAEQAAIEAEGNGVAEGPALRLKARMASGSALVAAQEWQQAAQVYEETAALAQAREDTHTELECWRMASWCRETAGEAEPAWEDGQRAWAVGKTLDPEARATSTLAYVAEALLRLARARGDMAAARDVESEAEAVLGEGWMPKHMLAGRKQA